MAGPLSGTGVGLQVGQALYPNNLSGGELVGPGNSIALAPGNTLPIPRGRFMIDLGGYAVLQEYDPTSTTWRMIASSRSSPVPVDSDGFNIRVANLTGCAVGAIVTAAGTSYVQASTTATPSAGNATFQPVIGGLISTTVSITASGTGYGKPPLVFIPPPPAPGAQARAVAVISSGTVSSITVIDQGAGYQTAPVPQIFPDPFDPNLASGAITAQATAKTTLTGAGTLAMVLCTNHGTSFTTVPSLAIACAGSSATATIVPMWTVQSASITSGGAAFSPNVELSTFGGVPAAGTYTNPAMELTGYIPRRASILLTSTGGTIATVGTIYDGGLFCGTPNPLLETQTGVAGTTGATIALTMGSVNASVSMQKID